MQRQAKTKPDKYLCDETTGIQGAAAILRVHPNTVQEWAKAGIIPGVKKGREWVFIKVDLLTWLRAQYGQQSGDEQSYSTGRTDNEQCHSTGVVIPGGFTSGGADKELEDLLRPQSRNERRNSTTSLRIVSGGKSN